MMNTQILKTGRNSLAMFATILGLGLTTINNAHAVPVVTGGAVGLSGTTSAARPELAGAVLIDRAQNFTMTAASGSIVKGVFYERVSRRSGSGTLDFSFRIKNDISSRGNVVAVYRTNYAGFPVVDVDYRTDGVGTVGAKAATFSADTVKFDAYNAPIKPGAESHFHFIGTRATSYSDSGVVTLRGDNGSSTRLKVFSPKVDTPAPTPIPGRRLPNLTVKATGPKGAKRGEDISKLVKIFVYNIGTAAAPGTAGTLNPANGFMIDVMLSSDTIAPAGYATYSPSYSEDVLLLGGRISNTRDIGPGANDSYSEGATIPRDTRPGRYYLAIRVDSGNKVVESNEADNTYFLPIQIF
ncbi:hypothetical protein EON83_06755 [bacterium]|nr:MAG: hypothetical protein EON83_06755 [bacterium]